MEGRGRREGEGGKKGRITEERVREIRRKEETTRSKKENLLRHWLLRLLHILRTFRKPLSLNRRPCFGRRER